MSRLLIGVFLLTADVLTAQVVTEMTPDLIEQAIKEGRQKPKSNLLGFSASPGMVRIGPSCYIATPYNRVVHAAYEAFKEYKPFTIANVTPEMTAPEVWVSCVPRQRTRYSKQGVRTIAMTMAGSRDVVPPIRTLSDDQDVSAGLSYGFGSVTAIYPPAAIRPEHEIHVVYAGGSDVTLKFDMKRIR